MLRKSTIFRMFGNLFVLFIALYMGTMYYTFPYLNGIARPDKTTLDTVYLTFVHFCFAMVGIAFVQTIVTDPGRVPVYWGFYLDDPDNKRKRYCLICHIFKPERCHHCSSCNRCVLNMDHHCPWLNNCIGFFNRKFFLLLLFYTVLAKGSVTVYYFPTFIRCLEVLWANDMEVPFHPVYLTTLAYLINSIMFVVIGKFFWFHVKLLMQNLTTIEHMEKKRNLTGGEETTNYDMGLYYNFIQIFGRDPKLWFLPFFFKTGKPLGDGVVWPQKPSNAQTYELESGSNKGDETYKSPKMNPSILPTGNATPLREASEEDRHGHNINDDYVSTKFERGPESTYFQSLKLDNYQSNQSSKPQPAGVNAYGFEFVMGNQQVSAPQLYTRSNYRFPSNY